MAEATAVTRRLRQEEPLYIVRPSARRLAAVWDQRGGSEWQDLDDRGCAWFVILGSETDDEKCRRLAYRFGLDAEALIAMRDDDRWESFRTRFWGPLR